MGIGEPDEVVGGVLVGVLHSVIHVTSYKVTMSGLGVVHIGLRSRSSSGSSGNLLGIGQSLPPRKWRPMPPFLVLVRLFIPLLDYIYCACLIGINPLS